MLRREMGVFPICMQKSRAKGMWNLYRTGCSPLGSMTVISPKAGDEAIELHQFKLQIMGCFDVYSLVPREQHSLRCICPPTLSLFNKFYLH